MALNKGDYKARSYASLRSGHSGILPSTGRRENPGSDQVLIFSQARAKRSSRTTAFGRRSSKRAVSLTLTPAK